MAVSGLGALAVGGAPIAGGALLGLSMTKSRPRAGDVRATIIGELALLERIPEDQIARREALKRTIENQVDDLVRLTEKSRAFRMRTRYFTEKANWRDLVLFVSAVIFAVIVWNFEHRTWHWLPMLVAAILLSVVTGITALHGFIRSLRDARLPRNDNTASPNG